MHESSLFISKPTFLSLGKGLEEKRNEDCILGPENQQRRRIAVEESKNAILLAGIIFYVNRYRWNPGRCLLFFIGGQVLPAVTNDFYSLGHASSLRSPRQACDSKAVSFLANVTPSFLSTPAHYLGHRPTWRERKEAEVNKSNQ